MKKKSFSAEKTYSRCDLDQVGVARYPEKFVWDYRSLRYLYYIFIKQRDNVVKICLNFEEDFATPLVH